MSGGQEVGTGYVTLLPSAKGFSRGVKAELSGSFDAAEAHGSSAFQGLFAKAVKWAAGAAVAIGGYFVAKKIFGGGLDRLLNIEDAQAKLRGLGHDAASVSSIMADALASVKGTAYGLDSAATAAAGAVAAGIKPGQELQKYLRLTADAASIAGVSMDEMGSIFNRVQTQGRAYTMELNQLADRGIPIYQWLADEYGVTATELRKMVAAGEVDAKTYRKVIEENIGGAALAAGDTTRGALRNLGASLARVGANLLGGSGGTGGVFGLAVVAIKAVTDALGPVEDAALRIGDTVGEWTRGALAGAKEWAGYLGDLFGSEGGGMAGLAAAAQAAFQGLVGWLSSSGIPMILDGLLAGRERLFNAALQLFPVILDAAMQLIPALVAWITGTALPQIVGAINQAVPLLAGMVTSLVPLLVDAVTSLAPVLLQAAVGLFMGLVTAAEQVLPTVVGLLVDTFPTIVDALVGAIPGLLSSLVSGLLAAFPQLLTGAIGLFMALADAVVQVVPAVFAALWNAIPTIVQAVLAALPQLLEAAVTLFHTLVDGIIAVLPELLEMLLGTVLPNIIDTVLAMLPELLTAAIDTFLALVDAVIEVLPQLIAVLVGVVLPKLLGTLTGMIPRLIETAVQLFLALVEGIIKVAPRILAALGVLLASAVAAVAGTVGALLTAGVELLGGLLQGVARGAVAVWDWFKGLPGRIVSSLGNLARTLFSAGVNLLQGFIDGVKSMAKRLLDAVLAPIKNAIAGVKDFLQIKSPSRLMASIARYTSDGFTGEMDRYGVAEVERVMGRYTAAIEVAPTMPASVPGIASALPALAVRVFVGNQEIRDLVRVEVDEREAGLAFDAEFVGVGS